MIERLDSYLEAKVREKVFPGAAYVVGTRDKLYTGWVGRHTYSPESPEVGDSTLWDMASVTKVMATTSSAMVLNQNGMLDLEAHVSAFLPRFRHDHVTVRDLLLHRSGLPAYFNFQNSCRTPEECEAKLFELPASEATPPKTVYSCIGFMTLQRVIESIAGKQLDVVATELVFTPLGMKNCSYRPLDLAKCAPTEKMPAWRRKIGDERGEKRVQDEFIQGTVHDPAAYMSGGVSGNAGLFCTAADLGKWLTELVRGGEKVFSPAALVEWRRRQGAASSRALGFDTKSPSGSSAGRRFHLRSYGHTGYTGTSVWIDPEARIFAGLLTNRVHPNDEAVPMLAARAGFHDAVWEELRSLRAQ